VYDDYRDGQSGVVPVRRVVGEDLYHEVDYFYSNKYNTAYLPCSHNNLKDIIAYSVACNTPDTTFYTIKFADGYKVYKSGNWIPVVRLNSTIWQYNADGTWQNAKINNAHTAISDAMTYEINRMSGIDLVNIPQYATGRILGMTISLIKDTDTVPEFTNGTYTGVVDLENAPDYLVPDTRTKTWASSEFEDLKDTIISITIDEANVSAHVDVPIGTKIKSGCTILVAGIYLKISTISNDGTTSGDIRFVANTKISTGTYPVQGIYGMDSSATITANDTYSVLADMSDHGLETIEQILSTSDDNVYYFVGDATSLKIYTNDTWTTVVSYTDNTWKYIENAQWIEAPINSAQSAMSKVVENTINRMTRTQLEAIPSAYLDSTITHVGATVDNTVVTNKTLSKLTLVGTDKHMDVTETDIKWRIVSDVTVTNTNELHGIRVQWRYNS
jgi:hypothetical protein